MKTITKKIQAELIKQKGFGLLELIVAMALFMIVVVVGAGGVLQTYSINTLSGTETQAKLYAQEGVEATHSIAKQNWALMVPGAYGLDTGGGNWVFSGSSDTLGNYVRTTQIQTVQRDGSGNVVTSGGTVDPDIFKVNVSIDWSLSPTRNNTVDLETYLTNYRKAIVSAGDWSNPTQQSAVNIAGNNNGWKVQVDGSYAYVIRAGGNPDFVVIDISNLAAPTQVGSFVLLGAPIRMHKVGNYVYIASNRNNQELQIVDVSTPASPSLAGSYNLPGNNNALGVHVVGTTAYVTRDSSGNDELIIFDASTPGSPTILGSVNLTADGNDIIVIGNYAYIASDSNTQELQVVDVSNTASPFIAGSLGLSGNNNAETVDAEGSIAVIGRANGDVDIIDISTPTSPSSLGTYDAGSFVRDVDYVASLNYVFVANDNNPNEFQVIDISTPATPTLVGFLNLGGDLNGVFYDSGVDRAFGVGDSNTDEFIIVQPN